MGFNYGLEKKNFDRQWAIMRKQYEDAGMSIEVIQAMYEYDWSVFNAARSYQKLLPGHLVLRFIHHPEVTARCSVRTVHIQSALHPIFMKSMLTWPEWKG